MFVGDEVLLEVSFDAARGRLASLARGGVLLTASQDAYAGGVAGLSRAAVPEPAPEVSRLVGVKAREPVDHGGSVVMALRWEAIGPGGELFPALDADITLAAAGPARTSLRLEGAYRPPLGGTGAGLDRATVHRVATAMIRDFLGRFAAAITSPAPGTGAAEGNGHRRTPWRPPETEVS